MIGSVERSPRQSHGFILGKGLLRLKLTDWKSRDKIIASPRNSFRSASDPGWCCCKVLPQEGDQTSLVHCSDWRVRTDIGVVGPSSLLRG